MKNFLIAFTVLSAFATNSLSATGPLRPAEHDLSTSVLAVKALISRCLPRIAQGGSLATAGLGSVDPETKALLLSGERGEVLATRDASILIVNRTDVPVCKVIALHIDPAVLGDLVVRVFSEAETSFRHVRFRLDKSGGFAAVYTAPSHDALVVLRITTGARPNGTHFATLSLERDANGV